MNNSKGWFHTEITEKSKSLANQAVLKNEFTVTIKLLLT